METIEYRTQDKTQWGNGDWQNEPDKKQWQDTETGYPCLIVCNRERSISSGSRSDPCCSRKCLPLKMVPAARLVVRT
jgi:hypothetical protein